MQLTREDSTRARVAKHVALHSFTSPHEYAASFLDLADLSDTEIAEIAAGTWLDRSDAEAMRLWQDTEPSVARPLHGVSREQAMADRCLYRPLTKG